MRRTRFIILIVAGLIIINGAMFSQTLCVNNGFEMGDITGWTASRGTNTNSCLSPITATPISLATSTTLLLMVTTPFSDPGGAGGIPNSPFPGNKVIRLNDNLTSGPGDVVRLVQQFSVTSSNFLYQFAYKAFVVQGHTCCEQPYMTVRIKDCLGNYLPCPSFTIAPECGAFGQCGSLGMGPTGASWLNIGAPSQTVICMQGLWSKYSIDLYTFINSCVSVEVTASDCIHTANAHAGYAYFDSNCGDFGFILNGDIGGTYFPAPTQTVNITGFCTASATLSAPNDLAPYIWNGPPGSLISGVTQKDITAIIPGAYTISMNPPGSCTPIVRILNVIFPPIPTFTVSPATGICSFGSNTLATITVSGSTSYTWATGAIGPVIAVSPITTSIYAVSAQTGSCVSVFSTQVVVNPNPVVSINSTSGNICAGESVTLSAIGALTYSWSTGSSSSSIVVTPAVTTGYSVVGTSAVGCISIPSTFINVTPPFTVFAFNITGTICQGNSALLIAGGGSSHTWYPGGIASSIISVTPSVTTTYTAIGVTGPCTNSNVLTVLVNPAPTLSTASFPAIICPADNATLTAIGALAYTWNPGGIVSSSIIVSPTITTTYSVTGVNINGCLSTRTISQMVYPFSVSVSPSSPSICLGSSYTLSASGAPNYTWNPGNISPTNSIVVSPGVSTSYTVMGNDGICSGFTTIFLTVSPSPTILASSTSPSTCSGLSVSLSATGANSYTWMPVNITGSNISVSPTISTTYTIKGDVSGCSNTSTITLVVNGDPTLAATASPTAICPGGVTTLSVSGANTYTWNPGSMAVTSLTVSPAATTIYSVTGTNAFGCLATRTLILLVNPNPTVNASTSSPSLCAGGSVTLTGSGAATYSWNPGTLTGTSVIVSPLASAVYSVSGTSSLGCSGQNTIPVAVVSVPVISVTTIPAAICAGFLSSLTASGANNYTWMPVNVTGSNISVSPTITTTYTITGDVSGCSNTSTLMVVVNGDPILAATASPTAICPGGITTLSVSGANTYTWNPGNMSVTSLTVSPAATTLYSVTGTNAFGCLATRTLNLIVNPNPLVNAGTSSPSLCAGGTVTLTGSGAATYSWNPGALTGTSVVVSPLVGTTYSVSGTSSLSCIGQNTISVAVVSVPVLSVTTIPAAICVGFSSSLTATGASSYTWMPVNVTGSNISVSPPINTTYTVFGNMAGCSNSTTLTLIVNGSPTLAAIASPTAICPGGVTTLSVSGANTYTWNPGSMAVTSLTVSPVATSLYSVTGTNGFGCLATRTLNLVVNPTPTVNAGTSSPSLCAGGTVTLTGLGAATYSWNPGTLTGTSVIVSPLASTVYSVSGTSSLGCVSIITATLGLNVFPLPSLSITALPGVICLGQSASLIAGGAANYLWSTGSTNFSLVVTPSVSSIYSFTGTSVNACVNTLTTSVVANPLPTISVNNGVICPGNIFILNPAGATTYTYSSGSATVFPTSTTNYSIIGTDANGCISALPAIATVSVVNTLTVTVSGTNVICEGQTASLTASGATTYSWSSGASGNSITLNPTVTTNYTVMGISGTCSNSAVQIVSVNPLPIVQVNSGSICLGSSFTITASGALTYTYSGGSAVVTPTSSSNYSVTGTGANGCISLNPAVSQVVVNALPTISIQPSSPVICIGKNASLTAIGAGSYTWNTGENTAVIVVSPTITTTYTVMGTDGNGCPNLAIITLSVNVCTGITETGNYTDGILVYPNPNKGEFTINASSDINLSLKNELGQTIRSFTLSKQNNHLVTVTEIAPGIYFIVGENNKSKVHQKIIITR